MSTLPQPIPVESFIDTKTATLYCAGECYTVTLHEYQKASHAGTVGVPGGQAGVYDLHYGCTKCGTLRKWGTVQV